MAIDFYFIPPSPPCRTVLLVAEAVGLDLNKKPINLLTGEQFSEDFMKINPQHTVPTIDDNGFVLFESRAIIAYFVNQYGKDDSLYPKDPKKRAVVDQRLYFDLGTLYKRIADYYAPVIFNAAKPDENTYNKIQDSMETLNVFLDGQDWVAGDNITIADYSIIVSVSTAESFGLNVENYPNVSAWYSRCKDVMSGYQELNQEGANTLGEMFKSKQD